MLPNRTRQLGLKVTDETHQLLDRLAKTYGSRTNVIEHAVGLLADSDIAGVLGNADSSQQQGLLLLCDLLTPACAAVENLLDGSEWNLIAETNCGIVPSSSTFDCTRRRATAALMANVEDSIIIDRGSQWLGDGPSAVKRGKSLLAKVKRLSELERWAVILAVQFFWEDASFRRKIDLANDSWWTLDYRREYIREIAGEEVSHGNRLS